MKLNEIVSEGTKKAEEWWSKVPPNFYADMQQDLRAIGRSEEHIWHEFITQAFEYGYCEALRKECEDCKEKL